MKSCQEIMQLASDSLDKELPLAKRLSLKLHLMLCASCREGMTMLKTIRKKADDCCQSEKQLAPAECLSEESRSRIIVELQRDRDVS